ncbi:YiiX/YebB-like N1pC/P60 family cysteine hydrolase [Bradyrhizobium sp. CCBAU 53421]|uniref:YiiX/YebB-like N1pC/P60 family cysteine hydrolase n=1 Tax=Bradyrhizobium sp. CCBAU 53421 TaxID=1325120 RepID=UPI00188CC5E8|nr:YiiX/YebB-like N1pC/P60 family cysteine hydrolase [Bradyrhizobium sp. CCBAU 53421]
MKRIKIDSVEPGDILLTARPGKVSKAIRFTTGGVVSHAMICVQHGSFIDSTSSGVQARNLQRELFEDDEKAFHFRLKDRPDREVLERIVDYARSEIGARYSKSEAARSVAAVRRPRSKRQFCSRLVARVYKTAGIELVPDADYCSPEDLRISPLLKELPVEFEPVSADELAWTSGRPNPIQAMHDAQNAVLDAARSVHANVENFNDIYDLLVRRPESDQVIAAALKRSGYLNIWKFEVEEHPWRYTRGLIDNLSASPEALRDYCIGTVKEAYSGGIRYSINLVQLRALQLQHPRESFRLEIALYETLVRNDQSRREVAYDWLQRHCLDLLEQHMEQIEPHTEYWWSLIDRVEPKLAVLSRHAVSVEGRTDICSTCGDDPAKPYRVVNGAEHMPGVPSLRLCDDCLEIRRGMGHVLMPFLLRSWKT